MPNNSSDIAQFVVAIAGTYLLHSTILLAGAWFVVKLGRVRSHVFAERLWKMAAVLGLVTTPLQLSLGWSSPVFDVPLGTRQETQCATSDALNSEPNDSFHAMSARDAEDIDKRATIPSSLMFQDIDAVEEPAADLSSNGEKRKDDALDDTFSPDVLSELRDAPLDDEPVTLAGSIEGGLGQTHLNDEPSRNGRPRLRTAIPPRQPQFAVAPSTSARYAFGGAILTAVFCIGGLSILLVRTWLFYRRCSGSGEIGNGPGRRILDRLLWKNSIRRQVCMLSSGAFHEPVAYGLVRWTIVLPNGMEQRLGKDELKALLAHELAHLVRGDVIWLWIGRVLCSCLAFQPLNFLARRRWQHAAEFLCDDWAVGCGGSAISLARCLTRIAEWRLEERECAAGLAAGGSKAKIVLRVERLVSANGPIDAWARPYRRLLLRLLTVVTAASLVCIAPRVVPPARANVVHNRDAQTGFLESDLPAEGIQASTIETDQDWHLLEEELLQLEYDLSYAFRPLIKTSKEPEVHESAERMRRRVLALQQRRQTLAERMKKELDR